MDDDQQPALFESAQSTGGSSWAVAIPVVIAIPIGTFIISLMAIGHDPAAGALNGLAPIEAGVLAFGAFVASAVIVRVATRSASQAPPDDRGFSERR
jgi:hypothetical protein